jgi:hypothetical protein
MVVEAEAVDQVAVAEGMITLGVHPPTRKDCAVLLAVMSLTTVREDQQIKQRHPTKPSPVMLEQCLDQTSAMNYRTGSDW